MCDNNSAVQINHQHRTPNGHLARAWERNSRIRDRAPAPSVARGCGAQGASPLAPRWACAAARPNRAHRTGVAAGPEVFPARPAATWATSASASHPHGLRVAQRYATPLAPAAPGRLGARPGPPACCDGPSGRRITAESDPKDPHADADGNGILSIFRISKNRTAPQANRQYQHICIIITVQMVPGFAMWTPLSLKGSIKHQYGLFL